MVSHRVQDLARMAGQVIPRTPPVSALFLLALELLTWTATPTFYMGVWDSWPRACSGCTFTHPSNHHLSSSSHTVMVPKYRVIKNSEEFLTFSQELHGLHTLLLAGTTAACSLCEVHHRLCFPSCLRPGRGSHWLLCYSFCVSQQLIVGVPLIHLYVSCFQFNKHLWGNEGEEEHSRPK